MKRGVFLLVMFVLPFLLSAAEYSQGNIKLVLWEKSGRFSLYSKSDNSGYEALFYDQDPRTSYISVLLNDRAYKLGDSLSFKISTGSNPDRPSFVFESAQLLVTEEFSFIKTASSRVVNGISIKITVENKSASDINAGFRFVLDTTLGEKGSSPHFYIDNLPVNSETLTRRSDNAVCWVSKNSSLSLMGSITLPQNLGPDSVQFANWKRLNDVTWKLPYENGRNFNSPPYSIGDSAVSYYYEPRGYASNESYSALIFLAMEDSRGFILNPNQLQLETAAADQEGRDMVMISDLINRIDNYIESGNISEDELNAMEQTLQRLQLKYGISSGTTR